MPPFQIPEYTTGQLPKMSFTRNEMVCIMSVTADRRKLKRKDFHVNLRVLLQTQIRPLEKHSRVVQYWSCNAGS